MCFSRSTVNRGYWKELYPNIIFYTQDIYQFKYTLEIQNIELSIKIEYQGIIAKSLALINKISNLLFIVFESKNYSQFAKLEIDTLKMKKIHKIFSKFMFFGYVIFQDHHKIFYFLYINKLVIIRKNKIIRKFIGEITKILPEQLIIKMTMRSFNGIRQYSISSFLNKFQATFEQLQNIQISQINQEHGYHTFKQIGDFIILKNQVSRLLKQQPYQTQQIPTYYMELSILNQMPGLYGYLELEQNEKLKHMRVFDNQIFIITMTKEQINIFKIQDKQRILTFQLNYQERSLKKPSLNINYLFITNRDKPEAQPIIKYIDLKFF